MHFGFALNSSDIDLWNIDLLGTHLGTDFHPRLKFQFGIPSWKKLQLYEKFQPGSKIFQPGLKYNSLKKKEKLEG